MKRPMLTLQLQDDACIVDGRIHFEAIANDPCIAQQPISVLLCEGGHARHYKAPISTLKSGSFLQDRFPTQARLVNFQN